jgi:hypothetical protein
VERGLNRIYITHAGEHIVPGSASIDAQGWVLLTAYVHSVTGIGVGAGLFPCCVSSILHEVDAWLGVARRNGPGRQWIVLESPMQEFALSAGAWNALHIHACNKVRDMSALDLSAVHGSGPQSRDEVTTAWPCARFPQPELDGSLALKIRNLDHSQERIHGSVRVALRGVAREVRGFRSGRGRNWRSVRMVV